MTPFIWNSRQHILIESEVGGLIAKCEGTFWTNEYVFFLVCSACGYTYAYSCQNLLNTTLKTHMFMLY